MSSVTVTVTRTIMGEEVVFSATQEVLLGQSHKEGLLKVSQDVRGAMNEYLDTVAMATPTTPKELTEGKDGVHQEEVLGIVRNVEGGKDRVKLFTDVNAKYGVPFYKEAIKKYMQREVEDVPTERVELKNMYAKVRYIDGKPKRVVAIHKHE